MTIQTEALWNEFNERLLFFIKGKISNKADADDILQNVFLKIHQNLGELKEEKNLKSWIFSIARNSIIDYYRSSKVTEEFKEELEKVIESGEDNFNGEITCCIDDFINLLPEKYRETIRLYEFEELKHKEIAERLELSVSASKSRVQRGRNQLKLLLEECCKFQIDKYGNILDYQQKNICCDN
ncbi:RNA polymerase sigma factor SigZ [Gottfriedia sp. NPDC057991]|uniref:RNA polymerase sigma factor SigZ n=1 Tax=Gottfriedia sp. NPDC057991 TaxID=3346298 RepID=UPI0036D88268